MSQREPTVLYDGDCGFCTRSVAWLRPRVHDVAYRSFRDAGVLEEFPQVTAQACERAMQFVREDGRPFAGAEAFVRVLARRALGKLLYIYYMPGVRQIADWSYAWIARNRFRFGRAEACETGACGVPRK